MAKIGAVYNLFDGEELLEYSIKSIRKNVDYIVGVYQTVSNMGEKNDNIKYVCENILRDKLFDEIISYDPDINFDPHINETNKRNIGLQYCRKNNCTHFLNLDTDELYIPSRFKKACDKVIESDIDTSVCRMKTYYKEPCYIIQPLEEYYVPFLYKINNKTIFEYGINFPVLIDPTRRIRTQKTGIFKPDDIVMHHLSYIRNDIKRKFRNSSSLISIQRNMNILIKTYEEWNFPNKACIVDGYNVSFRDVRKVENIIENINRGWCGE